MDTGVRINIKNKKLISFIASSLLNIQFNVYKRKDGYQQRFGDMSRQVNRLEVVLDICFLGSSLFCVDILIKTNALKLKNHLIHRE
jgi:hypothetical protein